jgi:hypothetical protein
MEHDDEQIVARSMRYAMHHASTGSVFSSACIEKAVQPLPEVSARDTPKLILE